MRCPTKSARAAWLRFVSAAVCLLVAAEVGAAQTEPESRFFTTSDGVRIHYLVAGDAGSHVLLIHGYTSSARSWARLGILQALADNHQVIAIDLRDHGHSGKTVERLGVGESFDSDAYDSWFASISEVAELLEHLEIERAHLHGYSMGGSVVEALLLSNQERFIAASFGGYGIAELRRYG